MPTLRRVLLALALSSAPALAQQPIDSAYTAKIRELTPVNPNWKFTTDMVDYLPASSTVPSPLKVLGYVPGTIGRLSKTADLNRYLRAVAAASPRAKLFSLGTSEGGKEMVVLAVSDEATIAKLDDYRAMLARLGDPRGLSSAERARLIASAKPIYWLTGSIHSPESGSPEMLMELAYRLAVDESANVKAIRDGVITLITPATEVDGRDRMVDAYTQSRALKLGPNGTPLVYWGKYTAHDNNRDGISQTQKLTQNMMQGFLYWHPLAMHDLHESVAFLYTSTGLGPYNEQFDPIQVNEWHQLAYQEINELTKRGLPGVWTHSFYDGWAPNYMLSIINFRNGIGKFYETYTSSGADCHTTSLAASATSKEWDRPNPPVNGIRWCIRSNINYQQSGVLVALRYMSDNARTFLDNYAAKAERTVKRGQTGAPYAFVIPRAQRHAAEAADLVNLFRRQGIEIHTASADFRTRGMPQVIERGSAAESAAADGARRARGASNDSAAMVQVKSGDWIIRLDQPYAQLPRTLLAQQRFKADDPSPYDDTGWTLDAVRHLQLHTIADSSLLAQPMQRLESDARVPGGVQGEGAVVLVAHTGDWRSAIVPFRVRPASVTVADSVFTVGGRVYAPGTFIVKGDAKAIGEALTALGVQGTATAAAPGVRSHAVTLPRIALMHSWLETQNEGWVRFAFDDMKIPYTYISDQSLRNAKALDRFDVVFFEHVSAQGSTLLNGRPMVGPAIPWKRTATTPDLGGLDETDDIRPGMGLTGAATLRAFVERGGLLIVTGNSTRLPIELGFNSSVSIAEPRALRARGGIYRAQTVQTASPILYGYDRSSFPVYFNQTPLLSVSSAAPRANQVDWADTSLARAADRQRARVVLRFHDRADSLLVSGQLVAGEELAGKAAVIDAPVGLGHTVMFAIRPIWRHTTQGTFALPLNAIVNWNNLDVGAARATAADARTTTMTAPGSRDDQDQDHDHHR
jgi:hypothetical protein